MGFFKGGRGKRKASDFSELLGKIQKKIAGWKMKLLSAGGRTILLRHVLSSMATNLLAVLQVPKTVLKALNKLLSSFFWGESHGKGKRKWISWNHICKPIEEGGLGIRDFGDIQKALHWKLAWRLIKGQSLWADFFRGKYARGTHLSLVTPTKGTRFWKSVASNIQEVLSNSKWSVRDGNISFWYDNWANGDPLCSLYPVIENPLLKIKDCHLDNEWDISLLDQLVGQQKAIELYQYLARRKEGEDVLIWLKDDAGKFTMKSAWDCIRVQAPPLPWAHWIWHTNISKRISIMMWKAYYNCLSVDDQIKRIGIPTASRCNCCSQGHTEDLNHVLCSGDIAKKIWRLAAINLGVHMGTFQTWKEQINFWFRRAGKSSQLRIVFGILPSIISWTLWEWRCKARFEAKEDTIESICINNKDMAILNRLDIHTLPTRPKKVQVVRWFRPKQGWVKLNIDSSSLGNPGSAGAGGVIRDEDGKLLGAFSVFLGQGSNNYAEMRSLLEGIRRCHHLGFYRIEIESDSQLLGAGGLNADWFDAHDLLPSPLRGLLRMDRLGLPYLRTM
ncbi:hypothetical protein I3760_02G143800 [Carya illinoinensis]|nr:hypothetical protein I3760_02G143800 [Carya illinoinensis]